jgi:hypothetical protein
LIRRKSGTFARPALRGLPHRHPAFRVLNQTFNRPRQVIRIIGRHQKPAHIVLHHFRNSARAPGDARTPKYIASRMLRQKLSDLGREQSEVGGLQIIFNVIHVFAHDHAVFQSQPRTSLTNGSKLPPARMTSLNVARADARDGFEQQINALHRTQIGGVDNHHLVVATPSSRRTSSRERAAAAAQKNCG